MKHLKCQSVIIYMLPLLALIYSNPAFPEATQNKMVIGDTSESIEISSDDSFEIDNKRQVVTFIGNVEAVRDDMNIKCQKIELFYENLSGDNAPEEGQVKILEIIASESVRISRPDGGIATAEKAVYNQQDEKVVLTGNPAVKWGKDSSESIEISSDDSSEIDNKRQVVTFIGNVEAVRDNMNIKCQKIELFYENLSGDNAPEEGQVKILEIIASENVRISRPDGGIATAEKAVYNQQDEKVVLTGNPAVKQGKDFVEGSKITLFLKEDRIVVEGSGENKAKAVLIPNEEER